MKAYQTSDKFFFNLNDAIEYAKQKIRERYYNPSECSEIWKITEGKNHGYCVAVQDDWTKIGNSNLMRNTIRTIIIE